MTCAYFVHKKHERYCCLISSFFVHSIFLRNTVNRFGVLGLFIKDVFGLSTEVGILYYLLLFLFKKELR